MILFGRHIFEIAGIKSIVRGLVIHIIQITYSMENQSLKKSYIFVRRRKILPEILLVHFNPIFWGMNNKIKAKSALRSFDSPQKEISPKIHCYILFFQFVVFQSNGCTLHTFISFWGYTFKIFCTTKYWICKYFDVLKVCHDLPSYAKIGQEKPRQLETSHDNTRQSIDARTIQVKT